MALTEKEKRINKEKNKLKKIFKELPKEIQPLLLKLIERASFLLIVSEDLEEEIKLIDTFVTEVINGAQQYSKPNPLTKEYRDTVKSYQSIIKQLMDIYKSINSTGEDDNLPDPLKDFVEGD